MTAPIGVAGLGLMGQAFASRLLAAGHPVFGYDIREVNLPQSPCLTIYPSFTDLASRCEVVILAVFDTAQVQEIIFGDNGLLANASEKPFPKIICSSTCDPEQIEEIGRRCHANGIAFLELPFSGTSMQVARGEGVGLAGGDQALCEELSWLLDLLCPTRHHIGKWGDANRAKLAVNLVLGLHRASLAEGLNFGQRIGLDPARLLGVLQNSAAASSVMKVKGPLMVQRKYDQPQSRVDQSLKDFGLIRELARKTGQNLPFADVYVRLLDSCTRRGEGQMDNAVIYEAIARNDS